MSKQAHILKARAEKLARVFEVSAISDDSLEVLVFKLAQERYAIETQYIKEVYPYKDYTILPNAPAFISGIVNIRRRIVSIFNLKVFFGLPSDDKGEKKLIIVENQEMEFALLSDGIHGIQRIPLHDIQPSLPTLVGVKQDLLRGVTSERIIILDGKKLLGSKQIIVDEGVP